MVAYIRIRTWALIQIEISRPYVFSDCMPGKVVKNIIAWHGVVLKINTCKPHGCKFLLMLVVSCQLRSIRDSDIQ